MTQQEFMLNDNAKFVFQYGNKLYKLNVTISSGIITLEELHANKKSGLDIKKVIFLEEPKETTDIVKSDLEPQVETMVKSESKEKEQTDDKRN